MAQSPHPLFNNQMNLEDHQPYFATTTLKSKIVAQLAGKTIKEQEEIVEGLLKMLDVNLLAALNIAYSMAPQASTEAKTEE
ncbi:hypothetical protein [Tengunoibacter tsumagoiensis]|uniref:Uncharacterized protein n=1 Tax=Tengunoibacter tsumagoiensis TaxID=2014871 RepID=A0A402A8J5_9CHLR|nr:hypothetical protein [Tengunoibacter tsumagoiensis]GCE15315.1 hypothetical protein KTT_51740 [Tengunoibacter tsumagoiensis]